MKRFIEFNAKFDDGKRSFPLLARFHAMGPNQFNLSGTGGDEIADRSVGALTGSFEGSEIRADTTFVGRAPNDPGDETQAGQHRFLLLADELSIRSSLIMKPIAFGIPRGTELVATWLLSGSRFIADLVRQEPLSLTFPGAAVKVWLDSDVQQSVRQQSGHAIQETTFQPSIELRAPVGGRKLPDIEGLGKDWERFVDVLSACLSFYSRATVGWLQETMEFIHAGEGTTRQELSSRFRRRRVSTGPDASEHLVPVNIARSELQKSLDTAAKWGPYLRSAIEFYVSSFVLSDESRFISLSTAVEALKEAFLSERKQADLFSEPDFTLVRGAVQRACATTLGEIGKADLLPKLEEKFPDLNRPSYRDVIQRLCTHLEAKTEDLYPSGLSFLKIRNEMVHSGKIPAHKVLVAESEKLTRLVERLVVGMLQREPTSILGAAHGETLRP